MRRASWQSRVGSGRGRRVACGEGIVRVVVRGELVEDSGSVGREWERSGGEAWGAGEVSGAGSEEYKDRAATSGTEFETCGFSVDDEERHSPEVRVPEYQV